MQNHDIKLGLYLMTAKGVAVLKVLLFKYGSDVIAYVVAGKDNAIDYDGYEDICDIATRAGIPIYSRLDEPPLPATYLLAISWRWLIKHEHHKKLIVFHDSLLPRYRGFSPLVCALINGDQQIGVTALFASEAYDQGDIIEQESITIAYPITIAEAIKQIILCYETLALKIISRLFDNALTSYPQNESAATYSLWRDADDYYIDWSWDAPRIQRFVDAVGSPYMGAAVVIDNKLFRIRECLALPDVFIENRSAGKVIFTFEGLPVVVCGQGLLKIIRLTIDGSETNVLPLQKFRTRFSSLSSSQQ